MLWHFQQGVVLFICRGTQLESINIYIYVCGESYDLLHAIPGVVSHGNNMNINQLNTSTYSQHRGLIYLAFLLLHSVPAI